MNKNADYWIEKLKLEKHPEGGYYSETYRSAHEIQHPNFRSEYRDLSTSIYFMLTSDEPSKFHQLRSDELWYYHMGSAVVVHFLHEDGCYEQKTLGPNIENGEHLQVVIPTGSIFGAQLVEKDSYSLFGCMVSPGFDFSDFLLFPKDGLLNKYPEHAQLISKLS